MAAEEAVDVATEAAADVVAEAVPDARTQPVKNDTRQAPMRRRREPRLSLRGRIALHGAHTTAGCSCVA